MKLENIFILDWRDSIIKSWRIFINSSARNGKMNVLDCKCLFISAKWVIDTLVCHIVLHCLIYFYPLLMSFATSYYLLPYLSSFKWSSTRYTLLLMWSINQIVNLKNFNLKTSFWNIPKSFTLPGVLRATSGIPGDLVEFGSRKIMAFFCV